MKKFILSFFLIIGLIANASSQVQQVAKEKIKNSGDVVKSVNTNTQDKNTNQDGEEDEVDELSTTGCGGVERWDEKVLTDILANTVVLTPNLTTVAHLVLITTPTPNTTMPRYQPVEDSTYKVTCKITIKKAEADSDFHLVLSDGTHTLIGEIPDPVCTSVAVSSYASLFQACRNFINANIASGNVSNVNIPSVTVTGVAFVDPPHGQTGAAPNNLELHPIIDIHFASTSGNTVAAFGISNSSICKGQSVSLSDYSTNNPTSWSWTMTGGTPSSSSLQNPTVTYNTSGTFTVTLVATNASGSSTPVSHTVTVSANVPPAIPTISQNSNVLTSSSSASYQWYLNGTSIAGATSQTYTATSNGNYNVVIANASGCTSTSATVNVSTVGIMETTNGTKFQIYPNPANNNITIETEENNKFIVYITNTLGQQIIKKYFQQKLTIDLSPFGKGIYNIEVCDENRVKCHTQRVSIE